MPERNHCESNCRRRRGVRILAALVLLTLVWVVAHRCHRHPPHHSRIVTMAGDDLQLQTDDGWAKTVRLDEKTWIHQGPHGRVDRSALRPNMRVHSRDHLLDNVYVVYDLDLLPGQLEAPHESEPSETWPWLLGSAVLTGGLALALKRRR